MTLFERQIALRLLAGEAEARPGRYAARGGSAAMSAQEVAELDLFTDALAAFQAARDAAAPRSVVAVQSTRRDVMTLGGWTRLILVPKRDLFVGGTTGKDARAGALYLLGSVPRRRYARAYQIIVVATEYCLRRSALDLLGRTEPLER